MQDCKYLVIYCTAGINARGDLANEQEGIRRWCPEG